MNAYLDAMRHYATFTGRTSRAGFWLYVLIVALLGIAATIVDVGVLGWGIEEGGPVTLVVNLVHLIPGIAIGVRRLHDIDRTGWWMLIMLTGIGVLVIFIFNLLAGTHGPNRFGPDPRTYAGPA